MSMRRLPFHRVLHRPALFLGGERELALMTLIIAGGLAATGHEPGVVRGRRHGVVLLDPGIPLDGEVGSADEQGLRSPAEVSWLLPGALATRPWRG